MPILNLFLILIIIGVVIWAITTYIPMDAGIKNLIRIVGIIIAVVICLNAFGVIGSLSHVRVPQVK